MLAETFLKKLENNAPSLESLKKIGFNDDEAKMFIQKYIASEKPIYNNIYKEELLRLVNNYQLEKVEIGIISFYNKINESSNYFYLGKAEIDLLVINKITGEVQIFENDAPEKLLWNCASNGGNFLDALIHCVPFFNKSMFDDKLWNNSNIILEMAIQCSELAGGNRYLDFYKMFLGYFEESV